MGDPEPDKSELADRRVMDAAQAQRRARLRRWATGTGTVGFIVAAGGVGNGGGTAAAVVIWIGVGLAVIGGVAWMTLQPNERGTRPPDAPGDGPSGTDSIGGT